MGRRRGRESANCPLPNPVIDDQGAESPAPSLLHPISDAALPLGPVVCTPTVGFLVSILGLLLNFFL